MTCSTRSIRRYLTLLSLLCASGSAMAQYSTPYRNVENPDRFPFQVVISDEVAPPLVGKNVTIPAPAGKRTVLEFASVICDAPPNASITVALTALKLVPGGGLFSFDPTGTVNASLPIPVHIADTRQFVSSGPVKIYLEDGAQSTVNVAQRGTLGGDKVSCNIYLSGHTLTP